MTTPDRSIEYRFSGFRLDLRQRRLFGPNDQPLALSSRAFDTLLVLVEHAGDTLTKAQLMHAVWPSVVVEENNLNQAISSLRKTLGDNKRASRLILTVPGKGYCFVATLQSTPKHHATPIISNSVLVLPLTNLNPGSDNDLFSIGLHDEIINQLGKLRSLKVISRDSVLTLVEQGIPRSEISRMLRVESVLNGTILFAGEQARVNLQLQDPKTGVTLWSSTYEANTSVIGDMIATQTDIALRAAIALAAEIRQSNQQLTVGQTLQPTGQKFPLQLAGVTAR
jgi:DNA-binding winged helix-turn-helix (wHTH) protein